MKAAKWRELSDDEVRQKAQELTEEIFNLRFQLSMGVAKNPARVSHARREVARAHTLLRERGAPALPPVTDAGRPEKPAPPAGTTRSRKPKAPARAKAEGERRGRA
jgi:large subunit ribosomal protein L29